MGLMQKKAESDWKRSPSATAQLLSHGLWKTQPHLEYISNKVAQIRDHPIYLIITIPPQYGKSELISHWTPVWFIGNWPWRRIVLASYEANFAASWGGKVKASIEQNEATLKLQLSYQTTAKADWQIKGYGGGMYSAGIRGAITGRGGDLIIIDDPVKDHQEANSPTYREAVWNAWRSVIRPRKQPQTSFIIIMTRWHEADLVGRLLSPEYNAGNPELQDPWEVINLPAIAETNDLLGREEGEALWASRFSLDSLLGTREVSGPYWWSALYCGRPTSEGSGKFSAHWFEYYDEEDLKKLHFIQTVQIWDTAFKKEQRNDRSACITMAATQKGYYVLDCFAKRLEFPELEDELIYRENQYKPGYVGIEDKASGPSLIQQLRKDTRLPIKAIKVKSKDSKELRANSVTGIVEAHKVYLPRRAPWLQMFLGEVCGFPTAPHDDITDSFVHALRELRAVSIDEVKTGSLIKRKTSSWRE